MCGRFTLTADPATLHAEFGIVVADDHRARFNIAPSQAVLAVAAGPKGWRAGLLQWGLVPRWSRDGAGKPSINARAETVLEKPSFREAFERRRCLILADGFYEWQGAGKYRRPMLIRRRDGKPFAFAGLWEANRSDTGDLHGCAIITTTPNALIRPIHDRMPVILTRRGAEAWLDARSTAAELRDLLAPFAADELEAFPVSSMVNTPANDGPECVRPLEDAAEAGKAEG